MKGQVFKIKRFSLHDGPGIRTSVFLKGCPMRCIWCHNPEGLTPDPEVWHEKSLCIGCGECMQACSMKALQLDEENRNVSVDRDVCVLRGDCVAVCPSGALRFTGWSMQVEDILAEIEKDKIFYDASFGGVTLTGGEPFFQPEFAAEIFWECRKRKIHTAVETCLTGNWNVLKSFISDIDLFIVDLKLSDKGMHSLYTGCSNEQTFENFRMLALQGRNMIVRIPLVPGITDTQSNIDTITEFVHSINENIAIEKVKYNPLARNNYDKLGMPFNMKE